MTKLETQKIETAISEFKEELAEKLRELGMLNIQQTLQIEITLYAGTEENSRSSDPHIDFGHLCYGTWFTTDVKVDDGKISEIGLTSSDFEALIGGTF